MLGFIQDKLADFAEYLETPKGKRWFKRSVVSAVGFFLVVIAVSVWKEYATSVVQNYQTEIAP